MAELIRSVAQQATLLALNATIEAARVGEEGKGFAVVAAEMGNLAKQTSAATEKVDGQVDSIRSAAASAGAALGAIDEAIAQIERHASLVASAMAQQGWRQCRASSRHGTGAGKSRHGRNHMVNLGETAESTGAVAGALEAEAKNLGADADTVDTALRRVIEQLRAA